MEEDTTLDWGLQCEKGPVERRKPEGVSPPNLLYGKRAERWTARCGIIDERDALLRFDAPFTSDAALNRMSRYSVTTVFFIKTHLTFMPVFWWVLAYLFTLVIL